MLHPRHAWFSRLTDTSAFLFVFATAPSEAHWNRSRQFPSLAKWDAMMTDFLEADAPGKIAFKHPKKVFGFGDFK